jgi:hypothetical protein
MGLKIENFTDDYFRFWQAIPRSFLFWSTGKLIHIADHHLMVRDIRCGVPIGLAAGLKIRHASSSPSSLAMF